MDVALAVDSREMQRAFMRAQRTRNKQLPGFRGYLHGQRHRSDSRT